MHRTVALHNALRLCTLGELGPLGILRPDRTMPNMCRTTWLPADGQAAIALQIRKTSVVRILSSVVFR